MSATIRQLVPPTLPRSAARRVAPHALSTPEPVTAGLLPRLFAVALALLAGAALGAAFAVPICDAIEWLAGVLS